MKKILLVCFVVLLAACSSDNDGPDQIKQCTVKSFVIFNGSAPETTAEVTYSDNQISTITLRALTQNTTKICSLTYWGDLLTAITITQQASTEPVTRITYDYNVNAMVEKIFYVMNFKDTVLQSQQRLLYLQVVADGTYFVESLNSAPNGIVYTVKGGNVSSRADYQISGGQKTPDESTRTDFGFDDQLNRISDLYRLAVLAESGATDVRLNSINNLTSIESATGTQTFTYEYAEDGNVTRMNLSGSRNVRFEYNCQ